MWLALLAAYILAGAALVPFHGDESTQIYMGRDYYYLFAEGDFSKVIFDDSGAQSAAEQQLRLLNGTVAKTIFGWVAHSRGIARDEINDQWFWGRDYEYNRDSGRIPDPQLLNGARLSAALQLALAAAAFFQVVKLCLNRPTAYVASALFTLHPNMLINGRRAMMEGSHMLGLTLVLLAGVWLIRERNWWTHALLGVCAGFAIATKHPNIIIVATVFLAVSAVPLWRLLREPGPARRAHLKSAAGITLAGLAACLTFLLLNPAWWSAALEMPARVYSLRADLLQLQVDIFGGYDGIVQQIRGFLRFVFAGQHQYFEVGQWAGYDVISAQIERYERSGLAGILFGGTVIYGLVYLLLAAYGALALVRDSRIAAECKVLLLIWIGGSALFTLLVTPLPWARYYLPLVPALTVLVSQALVAIATMIWKRLGSQADGVAILA